MKQNNLLSPQRPVQRGTRVHDGTAVTEKVEVVWDEPRCATGSGSAANDTTQTVMGQEGRAYLFIAVDHCSGEFVGTHASSSESRWEALEPIRQGVTRHLGDIGPDVASQGPDTAPRPCSNDLADDF